MEAREQRVTVVVHSSLRAPPDVRRGTTLSRRVRSTFLGSRRYTVTRSIPLRHAPPPPPTRAAAPADDPESSCARFSRRLRAAQRDERTDSRRSTARPRLRIARSSKFESRAENAADAWLRRLRRRAVTPYRRSVERERSNQPLPLGRSSSTRALDWQTI